MQLFTAAQTRELDRLAIEEAGIAGIRLMARAGRAAFAALLEAWPDPVRLHIFCGTGNNGGDGFIVAELAQQRSIPVQVYQLGATERIGGDAALARERALAAGVSISVLEGSLPALDDGVVVDGLLGTGLQGAVREVHAGLIDYINHSGLPVLALDIPSGLCSDSGRRLGAALLADLTVTFIARKRGLYTAAGPEHSGRLVFADLGVPAAVMSKVASGTTVLELDTALALLPGRPLDSHKGLFGHVLVVGGDTGMGGAAIMAAEAAARCGAGLVSAVTRPEHIASFLARRPEIMARPADSVMALEAALERATVAAIGPGLGESPWSEQMFYCAANRDLPQVLDADALRLLAAGRLAGTRDAHNRILTPHPGEAAALLGVTSAEVQADRFAAVAELQRRYGGVVVLKGVGSLISDGVHCWLSPYGNPGMASGGMGDVLTGVIAALLAQGMSPAEAACAGVCLHGAAADLAARDGERGLLAGDLFEPLRTLVDARQ